MHGNIIKESIMQLKQQLEILILNISVLITILMEKLKPSGPLYAKRVLVFLWKLLTQTRIQPKFF